MPLTLHEVHYEALTEGFKIVDLVLKSPHSPRLVRLFDMSSLVLLDDGSTISQNPLVSRLLKEVFQSKAPKPKYTEVWDVQVVLSYLKTMHSVDLLSLKELSF